MKNTGKPSEEEFEAIWKRTYGKQVYLHRFEDSSDLTGRNKKITKSKPQPSDYVLCCQGDWQLAEVKSTWDEKRFSFGLMRKNQGAHAAFVRAAGGEYLVYVHRLATNQWYCIPYFLIEAAKAAKAASLAWEDLALCEWDLSCTTTSA